MTWHSTVSSPIRTSSSGTWTAPPAAANVAGAGQRRVDRQVGVAGAARGRGEQAGHAEQAEELRVAVAADVDHVAPDHRFGRSRRAGVARGAGRGSGPRAAAAARSAGSARGSARRGGPRGRGRRWRARAPPRSSARGPSRRRHGGARRRAGRPPRGPRPQPVDPQRAAARQEKPQCSAGLAASSVRSVIASGPAGPVRDRIEVVGDAAAQLALQQRVVAADAGADRFADQLVRGRRRRRAARRSLRPRSHSHSAAGSAPTSAAASRSGVVTRAIAAIARVARWGPCRRSSTSRATSSSPSSARPRRGPARGRAPRRRGGRAPAPAGCRAPSRAPARPPRRRHPVPAQDLRRFGRVERLEAERGEVPVPAPRRPLRPGRPARGDQDRRTGAAARAPAPGAGSRRAPRRARSCRGRPAGARLRRRGAQRVLQLVGDRGDVAAVEPEDARSLASAAARSVASRSSAVLPIPAGPWR